MTGQDFLALSSAIEEIKVWIAPSSDKEESFLKVQIDGYEIELKVKDSYVYINYSDTSSFELLSETEFWKQLYFAR